jgi:3-deoxy-D-manno-octulosonic acid kinase
MKAKYYTQNNCAIVYDAERIPLPRRDLFEPEYWRSQGKLTGTASGRGTVSMLETDSGPAVLRPYLRGGWPRHLSRDRYVYTGYKRSRPMLEFRMLASFCDIGLPVPAPMAALCERQGLVYRGSLLMQRLPAIATLADRLGGRFVDDPAWQETGVCIRKFHAAGVSHADLNARNILLSKSGLVSLVDFDRARYTPGKTVDGANNLGRLKRSLVKLWPAGETALLNQAWNNLLTGYHG